MEYDIAMQFSDASNKPLTLGILLAQIGNRFIIDGVTRSGPAEMASLGSLLLPLTGSSL